MSFSSHAVDIWGILGEIIGESTGIRTDITYMCHAALKALKAWYALMGEIYLENLNFMKSCGSVSGLFESLLCTCLILEKCLSVESQCGMKEVLQWMFQKISDTHLVVNDVVLAQRGLNFRMGLFALNRSEFKMIVICCS